MDGQRWLTPRGRWRILRELRENRGFRWVIEDFGCVVSSFVNLLDCGRIALIGRCLVKKKDFDWYMPRAIEFKDFDWFKPIEFRDFDWYMPIEICPARI